MIETVIGTIIGTMASWYFLVAVLLFAIWADIPGNPMNSNGDWSGWAVFWLLLGAVSASFIFSIPLNYMLGAGVVYVVVGMFLSVPRYVAYGKNYADYMVRHYRHWNADNTEKEFDSEKFAVEVAKHLELSRNKARISVYALTWPTYFLSSFASGLKDAIVTFVSATFGGYIRGKIQEHINKLVG